MLKPTACASLHCQDANDVIATSLLFAYPHMMFPGVMHVLKSPASLQSHLSELQMKLLTC